MFCQVIFSAKKALSAQIADLDRQLAAGRVKGADMGADAAAKAGARLGTAAAVKDPFFGSEPQNPTRAERDDQAMACLGLSGADKEACLGRINGPPQEFTDQKALVNPGPVSMTGPTEKTDPRHVMSDMSKESEPPKPDDIPPDIGPPFMQFVELSARGRARAWAAGPRAPPEPALLETGAGSSLPFIGTPQFETLLRQEPEAERVETDLGEELPPGSVPDALTGKPVSKDEQRAAIAGAGPIHGPMTHFGPFRTVSAPDISQLDPISDPEGAVVVFSTELCANEGSRGFVYAMFHGYASSDFPGGEVTCRDILI